jgi:hypothetical protein
MNAIPFVLLENDRSVFRAMSYPEWVPKGRIHFRAFRLRGANANFPEEDSISVGTSVAGAKLGLSHTHGVATLIVQEIVALEHGLETRETEDPEKAAIFGIPLPSECSADATKFDLSLTIAKDLAYLANKLPLILD